MAWEKQRIVESAGVRLSVREHGDPEGSTIVLVHGYPDNAGVWDGVVTALTEQSTPWHVVRYDVRGMGGSSAPETTGGYALEHLAADVATVVRAVSPDRPVHLVGHDWGSIQCWEAVTDPRYQDLFASFTSISGPSLGHVADWTRRRLTPGGLPGLLRQGMHSTYIALFRLPVLPERLWRFRPLRAWFRADFDDAVRGLELYRVNMHGHAPAPRSTDVPVQQIALTGDNYVLPAVLSSADPWCERLWRRHLPAGHWAPRTHPEPVARWIGDFPAYLAEPSRSPRLEAAQVR